MPAPDRDPGRVPQRSRSRITRVARFRDDELGTGYQGQGHAGKALAPYPASATARRHVLLGLCAHEQEERCSLHRRKRTISPSALCNIAQELGRSSPRSINWGCWFTLRSSVIRFPRLPRRRRSRNGGALGPKNQEAPRGARRLQSSVIHAPPFASGYRVRSSNPGATVMPPQKDSISLNID